MHRFGEISPLWLNLKCLGHFKRVYLLFAIICYHIKILSSGHTDTSEEKFIILTILILLIKKTILILLIMFKGENIEQFRNILLYNNLLNAATT